MRVTDAKAFIGHQVHYGRFREAGTLLRWLGSDLAGKRVLDVAGGDGYWAGQARKRGAHAVSIDLSRKKMLFGSQLASAPALLQTDALALPFRDGSFDRVMSICAIEHFDDGPLALGEIARVLAPGGELVMSADAVTRAGRWPALYGRHCQNYAVKQTYTHQRLASLLAERGMDVIEHTYQFRGPLSERVYLTVSAYGGRVGPNAAAVLVPFIAVGDWLAPNNQGSMVLIRARKRG